MTLAKLGHCIFPSTLECESLNTGESTLKLSMIKFYSVCTTHSDQTFLDTEAAVVSRDVLVLRHDSPTSSQLDSNPNAF